MTLCRPCLDLRKLGITDQVGTRLAMYRLECKPAPAGHGNVPRKLYRCQLCGADWVADLTPDGVCCKWTLRLPATRGAQQTR